MENPEFFQAGDQFIIEDLLDFPNDETMALDEAALDTRTDSMVADAGMCKPEPHFHQEPGLGELCLPYDDLAELEWLSNFVEESFSSDEFQKLQLIQGGIKAQTTSESPETHQYQFQPETTRPGSMFRPEMSVPAKARSKRSRAAPGNWTSRLLVVSPPPASTTSSSSTESDVKKTVKQVMPKKKEVPENSGNEGRKCLHCATDKTPQWRTGPMGPKTLCNACGVRYKSGRLVPEYRPAASPTFVLSKHSNSHRKVLELRKQKEMEMRSGQPQFHHQNYMFDHVNNNGDDYLIHQHIGPDFRQMI
ncbi:hypothetical protein ACJIZ3_004909 [Penstemon smallii]|uniref:GATA transcription factor n=1 Tax=Penstemon smallii TaxID=265156 RepID=A0ABD3S3F1_9LAMI